MLVCGNALRGRILKHIFWVIPTLVVSLIFTDQAVFAEPSLSISFSSDYVDVGLWPGKWGTNEQVITASTSSMAGYTISFATTGASSALVNQSDNDKIIPTFVLPDGLDSIPVDSVGDGYGYSIDEGLNFYPVMEPTDPAVEIFETSGAGTNEHTLVFGAKVPEGSRSGIYSNTFEIFVIANLEVCPAGNICYYGNGDDGTGSMGNQSVESDSSATLIASNFSRSGYGFAGWNTEVDGSGTDYGPNQTIDVGDLSLAGLKLYAKWVPSAGDLQSWNGCSDLSKGNVTALTDTRDGNTYAVAKYADKKCWTMENLRLDLSDSKLEISGVNTNNPTEAFAKSIDDDHPGSRNDFCDTSNTACVNKILHNTNNINRGLVASYDANDSSSSWYSYGNYYNWYTATAGNGTYNMSAPGATAEGDLCPAGWKLPTGYGDAGDLAKLDIAMGGDGQNHASESAGGVAASLRWRTYPYNFMYSGEQRVDSAYNRAISSSYATSSASSYERTSNLWIRSDGLNMNPNNTLKYRGQTIRCIINEEYAEIGNIHYDANGGTGSMVDAVNVNLGTALAANNEFTKQYASFVSWNTSPDGSGVVVMEGGSVANAANHMGVVENGTLNLYAIWRPQYSLVYDGNGADGGSMDSVKVLGLSKGNFQFVASNFSRDNYGFAGWSLDSGAAEKLKSGEPVTIYGPNENISIDNAFLANADANSQITVYAVWIEKDANYNMQSFRTNECNAMSVGDVIALGDARDSNAYAVTKLSNGDCWMMENLRLDPANVSFNEQNTNLPTSNFVTLAASSATSNSLCNNNNSEACIDKVQYNTNSINQNLTPSYNGDATDISWYSYGVMYNWYTATAGNGLFAMSSGNANGDICPAGWRLLTGGTGGEYAALNNLVNNGSTTSNVGLLKFPINFYYSGDWNNTKPGGRGSYGRWWTSTPDGANKAYRFGIAASGPTPTNTFYKWDAFAVRCKVK